MSKITKKKLEAIMKKIVPPNLVNLDCCANCEHSEYNEMTSYECNQFPIPEDIYNKYSDEIGDLDDPYAYFGFVNCNQKCDDYSPKKNKLDLGD